MTRSRLHLLRVDGRETPASRSAAPFQAEIDGQDRLVLRFEKRIQGRTSLFRRGRAVRDELVAEQPQLILRSSEVDGDEDLSLAGRENPS